MTDNHGADDVGVVEQQRVAAQAAHHHARQPSDILVPVMAVAGRDGENRSSPAAVGESEERRKTTLSREQIMKQFTPVARAGALGLTPVSDFTNSGTQQSS